MTCASVDPARVLPALAPWLLAPVRVLRVQAEDETAPEQRRFKSEDALSVDELWCEASARWPSCSPRPRACAPSTAAALRALERHDGLQELSVWDVYGARTVLARVVAVALARRRAPPRAPRWWGTPRRSRLTSRRARRTTTSVPRRQTPRR